MFTNGEKLRWLQGNKNDPPPCIYKYFHSRDLLLKRYLEISINLEFSDSRGGGLKMAAILQRVILGMWQVNVPYELMEGNPVPTSRDISWKDAN